MNIFSIIKNYKIYLLLLLVFSLSNCTTAEILKGVYKNSQDRKNDYGGVYKVGNPYKIAGKWYYPKEEDDYSEIGVASWYGEKFNKKLTANGEIFDKDIVSAAHRTLPLPSMVRVTNLENGRKLMIRVNDRGPFAHDRIIDLSEEAAKELGVWNNGTAKVKVEFDSNATRKMFAQKDHDHYVNKKYYKKTANVKKYNRNIDAHKYKNNKSYIQTGAFSTLHNANLMKKRLNSLENVFVENIISRGKRIYRVKVGPFSNEKKANTILSKLSGLGFTDAVITKN